MTDKEDRKPANILRIPTKKGSNTSMVRHGLYCDPAKWDLDGRTTLAKQLHQLRTGLAALFPDGPGRAGALLIDRVVYKSLKLALFEATDLISMEEVPPGAEQAYLTMSNSFRADLQLLTTMAQHQAPAPGDPDLREYLETLKRAAKAQVVNVERG
ncbi:MAG: hypothetical protein Q8M54_00435 [Desulfobaccales bacterium]|nr:hypothetical protein [Desulfobaccales bacterium]